jgi:hypothetical protein
MLSLILAIGIKVEISRFFKFPLWYHIHDIKIHHRNLKFYQITNINDNIKIYHLYSINSVFLYIIWGYILHIIVKMIDRISSSCQYMYIVQLIGLINNLPITCAALHFPKLFTHFCCSSYIIYRLLRKSLTWVSFYQFMSQTQI